MKYFLLISQLDSLSLQSTNQVLHYSIFNNTRSITKANGMLWMPRYIPNTSSSSSSLDKVSESSFGVTGSTGFATGTRFLLARYEKGA